MPLTDIEIKNAKPKEKQYRLADGGGLCLLVLPTGAKYWQLRYRFDAKGKLLALGVYPDVKLVTAREKAREAKSVLAAGNDPAEVKKQAKMAKQVSQANTFEVVAAEWFELKSPDWSETHKARTNNILKNNLGRWIGSRPISEITAPELLTALRNTEKKGTLETAKRSLQVAGQVFRYAVATGRAERVPSENLKGTLAAPKVKHFSAIIEPAELGKLLVAMDGYTGSLEVRAALQLSALLFQRPGEVRHMQWQDLDFAKAEWRYIATKTQSPHIVPLSSQAIEILCYLQPVTGRGRYVFPSARRGGRPMSENAVRGALRNLGYDNDQHTPHGFRATARTILDEVLGYRVDWIEHQLAHAVKDANGRAYNRTAHLEGRKAMMQGWADYLDKLKAQVLGKPSSGKQEKQDISAEKVIGSSLKITGGELVEEKRVEEHKQPYKQVAPILEKQDLDPVLKNSKGSESSPLEGLHEKFAADRADFEKGKLEKAANQKEREKRLADQAALKNSKELESSPLGGLHEKFAADQAEFEKNKLEKAAKEEAEKQKRLEDEAALEKIPLSERRNAVGDSIARLFGKM